MLSVSINKIVDEEVIAERSLYVGKTASRLWHASQMSCWHLFSIGVWIVRILQMLRCNEFQTLLMSIQRSLSVDEPNQQLLHRQLVAHCQDPLCSPQGSKEEVLKVKIQGI